MTGLANAIINTVPAAQELRKVKGFEPLKYLHKAVGADGSEVLKLDLRYKKLWFRLACPNGRMLVKPLRVTDQFAIFEAMVYQGYCNRYARRSDRNNPVEEIPADVSEWDHNQFNKKIAELVEKSLAEPEALKAVAVTSLPGIIMCNELGATFVPTLFEFLSMKSLFTQA